MEHFITPEIVEAVAVLAGAVISAVAAVVGVQARKYLGAAGALVVEQQREVAIERVKRGIRNAAVARGYDGATLAPVPRPDLDESLSRSIAVEVIGQMPDTVKTVGATVGQIAAIVPAVLAQK